MLAPGLGVDYAVGLVQVSEVRLEEEQRVRVGPAGKRRCGEHVFGDGVDHAGHRLSAG